MDVRLLGLSQLAVGTMRTRPTPPEEVYWFWVAVTIAAPAVAAPFQPLKKPGRWKSCLSRVALSMMNAALATGIGAGAAGLLVCRVSSLFVTSMVPVGMERELFFPRVFTFLSITAKLPPVCSSLIW